MEYTDACVGVALARRALRADHLVRAVSTKLFGRAGAFPRNRIRSAYGRNPYVGYDDVNERPFLYDGPIDERLSPMEKVVAVEFGGSYIAYPHQVMSERRVVKDEFGGRPIAVFHSDGTASEHGDYFSFAWFAFRPETEINSERAENSDTWPG